MVALILCLGCLGDRRCVVLRKMAKLILNNSCTYKSFRFGVDCAKCLADCALLCAESQTFVQDAPKLELLFIGQSLLGDASPGYIPV